MLKAEMEWVKDIAAEIARAHIERAVSDLREEFRTQMDELRRTEKKSPKGDR